MKHQNTFVMLVVLCCASFAASPLHARDYAVVAIGDSMTSGEGAPDKRANRNDGIAEFSDGSDGPACHRSRSSYATRAAEALSRRVGAGNRLVYKSFACSGATIDRGLVDYQRKRLGNGGQLNIPPQIDTVGQWMDEQGIDRLDAVILSIGINDIVFTSAVRDCTLPSLNCTVGYVSNLSPYWNVVKTGYRTLKQRLDRKLKPRMVFVMEYPDPLRDTAGRFCDRYDDGYSVLAGGPVYILDQRLPVGARVANIDAREAELAFATILNPLNQKIRDLVRANDTPEQRWIYVEGIASLTRYHGYCAGGRRYFNHFRDSEHKQGDLDGAVHPNDVGHQAIADRLFETLVASMRFTNTQPEAARAVQRRQ